MKGGGRMHSHQLKFQVLVETQVTRDCRVVHCSFHGDRVALHGVIVARLIPPISLLLPFYMILRQPGLINTCIGVAVYAVYSCYPWGIWILKSFF